MDYMFLIQLVIICHNQWDVYCSTISFDIFFPQSSQFDTFPIYLFGYFILVFSGCGVINFVSL